MEPIDISGKCLCGAVSFSTYLVNNSIGACHCDICKTWGGGPLLALDCGNECHFSGGEHIRVYATTQWAERGFCSRCGTHVFIRVKQSNHYILPAGLVELDVAMTLDHQLFIDNKPCYYSFVNQTKNQTREAYFAEFS